MTTIDGNSNLVRNTVIAAGVGAVAQGALNVVSQNKVLKDPQKYLDGMKMLRDCYAGQVKEILKNDNSKTMKEVMRKFVTTINKNTKKAIGIIKDLQKTGKINWKNAGKAAGFGAAVLGGAYLVYRGIKALFTPKAKNV